MTRVVISQPMYFPWPGFLAQLTFADVLIWLDDVQFSKGSFTNRVQLLRDGSQHWMTIELEGKGSRQQIEALRPSRYDWFLRHRNSLFHSIGKRECADQAMFTFDEVMNGANDRTLCDTIISSCEKLAQSVGILPEQRFRSSQLATKGSSTDRVLNLVQSVGGSEYITGHGAANYLDHAKFEACDMDVSYMDYKLRPWPQGSGQFTPYVTALDTIASIPYELVVEMLNPQTLSWREFLKMRSIAY